MFKWKDSNNQDKFGQALTDSSGRVHIANISTGNIALTVGNTSQGVGITSASAPIATALTASSVILAITQHCYIRQGVTPVALATGADQLLVGPAVYRLTGIVSGNKIAVIKAGTGDDGVATVTPE